MQSPDHQGAGWAVYNADCVELLAALPEASIDAAVYSSPFSSLYIYSDSERDMGNAASHEEFLTHHGFMARSLYRAMKPGAVICDHVKDTVFYQSASETGEGGLYPFSDKALQNYRDAGFVLRARITVWRDPVKERAKTNAERLLYKNIGENSRVSAPGMPEYILVLRKDSSGVKTGDPVRHAIDKWGEDRLRADAAEIARAHLTALQAAGLTGDLDPALLAELVEAAQFPLDQWQAWASPVWMDTRETDVLNARFKGPDRDEKHICPMPLDLIERCLTLYSNPGDVVLDPFGGIGSTGHQAIRMHRRYLGVELKPEYAAQAARFLTEAERQSATLFDCLEAV